MPLWGMMLIVAGALSFAAIAASQVYNMGYDAAENKVRAEVTDNTNEALLAQQTEWSERLAERERQRNFWRRQATQLQERLDRQESEIDSTVLSAVEGLQNALPDFSECPALGRDFIELHNRAASAAGDSAPVVSRDGSSASGTDKVLEDLRAVGSNPG